MCHLWGQVQYVSCSSWSGQHILGFHVNRVWFELFQPACGKMTWILCPSQRELCPSHGGCTARYLVWLAQRLKEELLPTLQGPHPQPSEKIHYRLGHERSHTSQWIKAIANASLTRSVMQEDRHRSDRLQTAWDRLDGFSLHESRNRYQMSYAKCIKPIS